MWKFRKSKIHKITTLLWNWTPPEQAGSLLGCCWGGWCGGPVGPRTRPRSGARGSSRGSLDTKKRAATCIRINLNRRWQSHIPLIFPVVEKKTKRTCAGGPAESVTVSSRRPSSIRPLERCPLSRFSALRAGDCGPPAWEMEEAAKLSSMSWCMSTLVGHDCLER